MQIKIAGRFRPFSHRVPTRCLILGTNVVAEVFPTLVRLIQEEVVIQEFPIDVKEFTVQQDLEKGWVKIGGKYRLQKGERGVYKFFEKGEAPNLFLPKERLSLGVDKKQNWERILERNDLKELFPLWHRLGLMTPQTAGNLQMQNFDAQSFCNLFLSRFSDLFIPQNRPNPFLGIEESWQINGDPLVILTEGAKLIRSLFLTFEGGVLTPLPNLFHEFHAGRFIHVPFAQLGEVSIEWKSRQLQRAILVPDCDRSLAFNLLGFKRFRINRSLWHLTDRPLELKANIPLFLDRFEK
jgi:hypothetical protein